MTALKLAGTAALPVVVSVLLYMMERKEGALKNLSYQKKQIIFGLVFGIVAIFGTEFGVAVDGAVMNTRDAAPLCAGLIFGAPAGILSGVIGGVERWFAVYWGAGQYTRLACTLATILAGLFGAAIRKFIFDDKKPTVFYGLVAGVVMEILHMLMVFITNIDDVATAFSIVQLCAPYMIVLNGLSVMLAVLFVSMIGRQKKMTQQDLKQISQTFQRWLAAVVLVAFLVTTLFSFVLQTELSRTNAGSLLTLNIADVEQDIHDASDENLLKLTRMVADLIDASPGAPGERLEAISEEYDIPEINLIDENGIIIASTYKDFLGYDMRSGDQSAAFLVLLEGETEFVQSYGPVSYDRTISRKYAGAVLEKGGFVQVGYDAWNFQKDMADIVSGLTRNRHIGEEGYLIIADANWNIVSDRHGNEGANLETTGIWLDTEKMQENKAFTAEVHGVPSYCIYGKTEGYYIIGVQPQSEAYFLRDVSVYLTIFLEIVIFAVLFILVYYLIKKLIVDNINRINASLAEITGGNLDVTVDVRSNEEFASLSDDINETVMTLKRYIDEAAARIDQELEYAKAIQLSAMPRVFPPYPDRSEFEIFASMRAAKEVGGDFYDFYLLGEDRLAFMIADVSGKGIPAAMFMMTSKTLIKSLAESGLEIDEVFTAANNHLCENNDAGMFVTAWMGIIDLKTGLVSFTNAGHNPPVVKRGNGSFEFLRGNSGFVLAGIEDFPYSKGELQLMPGDTIYLYTDGVTEATNEQEELYEEDRLLQALNGNRTADMETLCRAVQESVDAFADGAPQFDDITMLAMQFNGK